MGTKGTVASTAALALLLQEGIGDTIRVAPDAAARRVAHAGSRRRARDPAVARAAHLQPERHRVPGLRPHDQHHLPGARQADRRPPARADAGLEEQVPRRREPEGRGDGLHRQRPRREQACRHRHQPARHRRSAGRAGVHRRREGDDLARRGHREEFHAIVEGYIEKRFGVGRTRATVDRRHAWTPAAGQDDLLAPLPVWSSGVEDACFSRPMPEPLQAVKGMNDILPPRIGGAGSGSRTRCAR